MRNIVWSSGVFLSLRKRHEWEREGKMHMTPRDGLYCNCHAFSGHEAETSLHWLQQDIRLGGSSWGLLWDGSGISRIRHAWGCCRAPVSFMSRWPGSHVIYPSCTSTSPSAHTSGPHGGRTLCPADGRGEAWAKVLNKSAWYVEEYGPTCMEVCGESEHKAFVWIVKILLPGMEGLEWGVGRALPWKAHWGWGWPSRDRQQASTGGPRGVGPCVRGSAYLVSHIFVDSALQSLIMCVIPASATVCPGREWAPRAQGAWQFCASIFPLA